MNLAALGLGALRLLPCLALIPIGRGPFAWSLRVTLALTLALALCVAPPAPVGAPLALVAARELFAGAALALVLALPFLALDQAAALLRGAQETAAPVGRLARSVGVVAFLAARGHHGALLALAASWDLHPPSDPLPASYLAACLRATAGALAGALVIASSGLIALASMELCGALAARLSWPLTRASFAPIRTLVLLLAAALTLRACVEVALALARQAFALAAK